MKGFVNIILLIGVAIVSIVGTTFFLKNQVKQQVNEEVNNLGASIFINTSSTKFNDVLINVNNSLTNLNTAIGGLITSPVPYASTTGVQNTLSFPIPVASTSLAAGSNLVLTGNSLAATTTPSFTNLIFNTANSKIYGVGSNYPNKSLIILSTSTATYPFISIDNSSIIAIASSSGVVQLTGFPVVMYSNGVSNYVGFDTTALNSNRTIYFPNNSGTSTIWTAIPTASTTPCVVGQIAATSTYIYTCVSTNQWNRATSTINW